MDRYFVGITGASGHRYARRLVQALLESGAGVDIAVTGAGRKVLRHEEGVVLRGEDPARDGEAVAEWIAPVASDALRLFAADAVEAPPSSGTSGTRAYILCPCSMGTLARVAAGFSSNLVERAADVAIKEGRRLVVVPRETPLSEIHLENLLRLARLGAVVLPAMPGFYHGPRGIDDLVDHVVGKVLDRLELRNDVGARWSGELSRAEPEDEEARGLEGLRPDGLRASDSRAAPGKREEAR